MNIVDIEENFKEKNSKQLRECMDSLPTYFISYNACKWSLIALEWDLSISITADKFEPRSIPKGSVATTTTGRLVANVSDGSISYT